MQDFKVVVSLTSHTKERLENVPYFLYYSIFQHRYDYVKVVLTLYEDDVKFIPSKLQTLIDIGAVELIVSKVNLFCHLKYFYCMQKYRDIPVITIDDDSIYPKQMIPDLLENAKKYPNAVIGRSGVIVDPNKSYVACPCVNKGLGSLKWSNYCNVFHPLLNLEGYGGILYPADILRVSDSMIPEILMFPRADDIYLYLIELRNHIRRIVPRYEYKKLEVSTKGYSAISTRPDNVKMIDALIQKYKQDILQV